MNVIQVERPDNDTGRCWDSVVTCPVVMVISCMSKKYYESWKIINLIFF